MDKALQLSQEFGLRYEYAANIIRLIDEGNTIPFIARYRKEMHGGCDDQVLREFADRLTYLNNLINRKEEIRASIEGQGKWTDELAAARRVLLLGKGAASCLVELLSFRLMRFGKQVVRLAPGSDVAEGLALADDRTVLVAFGFQRMPAEVEVAIDCARDAGARSVLFTGRRVLPSEPAADVTLTAYRGDPCDYHSMTSAVALVDALVVAVAARMGEEAIRRLDDLRALKRRNEMRLPR